MLKTKTKRILFFKTANFVSFLFNINCIKLVKNKKLTCYKGFKCHLLFSKFVSEFLTVKKKISALRIIIAIFWCFTPLMVAPFTIYLSVHDFFSALPLLLPFFGAIWRFVPLMVAPLTIYLTVNDWRR